MTWNSTTVDAQAWIAAGERLRAGDAHLVSLWGEPGLAHMAVAESSELRLFHLPCTANRLPSIGRLHAPAIRLERAMRDLFGLDAHDAADRRPWLSHGGTYPFLPAEGESLHQIAVGPVHAGIIEPGHFRFTANGEAVVRLEQRLGYAHKGIDALMAGAGLDRAARLAGRVSGDSTVAYALAFSQAIEMASAVQVPPRAVWLRALFAELERLANHFGDIGAVCNDASFTIMHASFGFLREKVLRAAQACTGQRLMMDAVVPGGVRSDLPAEGIEGVRALIAMARSQFPRLVDVYENTASLKDRTVGTGILSESLARQFGAGGYVGRASGRSFDARRDPGYAPYDELDFQVPVVHAGDVNARVWIRIQEVEQSLSLVEQILRRLPPGATSTAVPNGSGEGSARVEAFRGDVFAWVRTGADGGVERAHLRDPSWFQWPLLEAAIEGNIVADFPLCNKSFNCSYSGHDL
ncbi:MAG: hydrogenase expression protein HypE [Betaproteobacteria bacterium]|nr:hydrogenase expression protein HypE [Betaproteobacteria bacterium]MBV9361937.1 hydrogenase expression protein HypE [Betaproteobacteria bacterium]